MARDDDEASGGEYALGCVVILILVPVGIFMRGWALTMMWGWFVTPFGIQAIGMAHALGLASCIALFHGVSGGSSKSEKSESPAKTCAKLFAAVVVVPLIIVGIGWIIHQYM